MKRFLIAASVIALSAPMPLHAQVAPVTAKVVGTCGTMSYVNGSAQPVTQDTTGTLCTAGGGGGGGGNVNLTGINGVTPSVGAGATGTGSLRTTQAQDTSTIAGSAPGTAGTPSVNVVTVQGVSGGTAQPVSAADGQYVNLGTSTDAASCASGSSLLACQRQLHADVSSAIPAGTAAIGTLTGSTPYGLQTAASTNATSVKGSAGVVKSMNLLNTTTTIYYLRTYNLASAPTCSSATGFVRSWPIPPAAAAGGAGGIAVNLGAGGTTFSTGIAFCVTGGASSTDNTNAATGVFINLDYQ